MKKQTDNKIILFLLCQSTSALNSTFLLAQELQEQGFSIIFPVLPELEEYVSSHGFQTRQLEYYRVKKEIGGGKKSYRQRQIAKEEVYLKTIQKLIKNTNDPDMVIVDQNVWWLALPFMERNIPLMGLNTTLATGWNVYSPPVFSNILPVPKSHHLAQRFSTLLGWLKLFCFSQGSNNSVGLYQLILSHLGLRPHILRKKMAERYGKKVLWGEYGYRLKIPELVLAPREFDFPETPSSPERCYVGACIHTNRRNGLFPRADSGHTEKHPIKFNFDWINPAKKLIYLSIGSLGHTLCNQRMKLFSSVIETMKYLPDCQLVIHIQLPEEAEKLQPVPANVQITQWAPQLEFLALASLFITHGGLGSVREAAFYGVPMIVFPFFNDGFGNASRVVYHHLGLRGDIKTITADKVKNLVQQKI